MSTLKRFWRLLRKFWDWDVYPDAPLVYVCSHNGVTGVVRADDFDDEVQRMRRLFKRYGSPWSGADSYKAVRPQVYPVFLFSDKVQLEPSFRVGSLDDLQLILWDCAVEERSFELPPMKAPGSIPNGYYGELQKIGSEGCRHRWWGFKQACAYLHGEPFTPDKEIKVLHLPEQD